MRERFRANLWRPPSNRFTGAVSLLAGITFLLVALAERGERGLGYLLGSFLWLLNGAAEFLPPARYWLLG